MWTTELRTHRSSLVSWARSHPQMRSPAACLTRRLRTVPTSPPGQRLFCRQASWHWDSFFLLHNFSASALRRFSVCISLTGHFVTLLVCAGCIEKWIAEPSRTGRPTCPACRQAFVSLRHCASVVAHCVVHIGDEGSGSPDRDCARDLAGLAVTTKHLQRHLSSQSEGCCHQVQSPRRSPRRSPR
eukprot:SAG31_NODE_14518_length_802_cov_0.972973_1_plen_184_part_01